MPGLYQGRDFDLAGFAVGAVERSAILPRSELRAGDRILGLASSGLHSNGFSLVRRVVAKTGASLLAPAPFAPESSLGRALLTPTRLYVKPLLAALQATDAVLAIAHVTGGGFPDNLPRVLPENLSVQLELGAFAPPPVFRWLAENGPVTEAEMLRTFNCGFGMIVFARAEDEADAARALRDAGLAPIEIGRLIPRGDARVVMQGRLDL
jgi:phosphoribosylformylglycinamidine cyclo-ligase